MLSREGGRQTENANLDCPHTGMPKGTITTRQKELFLPTLGRSGFIHLKPGDRMYTCLPLFHGAGHGLGLMPTLGAGATLVLSRKFSHKNFWPEIHASGATHFQYVGELCRYLVNAPPSPLDKGHKVRMAWGNGLRPDVWDTFRERFGIDQINELYMASDGMGSTSHPNRGDFTKSTIGVRGPIWHFLNNWYEKRILIDTDTQEIIRGPDGFAIEAKPGETGEMINWMNPADPDANTPTYYQNHGAAVKRRIRDVFKKGDIWYRSGDLHRLDENGRLYFVDRLGDTFRWHSENVSTNEVSDVVGEFPQIAEANVYGVLVPKADGRAGCAAIVPRPDIATDPSEKGEQFDWKALAEHCLTRLPRYAVPIFIRLAKQLEYTGTMKMQKGRLRTEGVEVEVIEENARAKGEPVDQMFWLPPGKREYVPFKMAELEQLRGGGVRL
jgi:acyl-CoA synthetase (AMP-forming)/AMP-acid ligase II